MPVSDEEVLDWRKDLGSKRRSWRRRNQFRTSARGMASGTLAAHVQGW